MQFINYFFASILSFAGLLIGIALIKIAPEEQKPLNRHFEIARKIILALIFTFLVFYYSNNAVYILALLMYLAFLAFAEYSIKDLLKKSVITYTALGIIFYLSSKNLNLFVIESSLILLYGIPTASIIFDRKTKNYAPLLLYNAGFLLIANLAYFI